MPIINLQYIKKTLWLKVFPNWRALPQNLYNLPLSFNGKMQISESYILETVLFSFSFENMHPLCMTAHTIFIIQTPLLVATLNLPSSLSSVSSSLSKVLSGMSYSLKSPRSLSSRKQIMVGTKYDTIWHRT